MTLSSSKQTLIVGGGIAGLTAALQCAKEGHRVTLYEKENKLGGIVSYHELYGIGLDAGAEGFSVRNSLITKFLTDLKLDNNIVSPINSPWLFNVDNHKINYSKMPELSIFGIPTNPMQKDIVKLLGYSNALRVSLEAVHGSRFIDDSHSLAELINRNLGSKVLKYFVSPVIRGVYASEANSVYLNKIIPELQVEIMKNKSIIKAARKFSAPEVPGTKIQSINGGMYQLVAKIIIELKNLDTKLKLNNPLLTVHRNNNGWLVNENEVFDNIIFAVPPTVLNKVLPKELNNIKPDIISANTTRIESLVLKSETLNNSPRGSGIFIGETMAKVKADYLSCTSDKWPWYKRMLDKNTHIVRLNYNEKYPSNWDGVISKRTNPEIALRDTSLLFNTVLKEKNILDHDSVTWTQWNVSVDSINKVKTSSTENPTIGFVGSWVHGTGLASIIPGALSEAKRICRYTAAR